MQTAPGSTRSTLKSAVGRIDSQALFERWQEQGDHAARAELIRRFTPLARKLARRYTGAHEPFDDLLQVATVGLVKAVDGFDRSRGSAFSSYAVPTIVGELKRYFRDLGWSVHVPRGAQEMALKVENAHQELVGRLGRAPTVNELAEYLELSIDEVVDASLTIARAARYLSPRERRVLELRFAGDLTQTQIAAEIGVSQMQVSRILRTALEKLRDLTA